MRSQETSTKPVVFAEPSALRGAYLERLRRLLELRQRHVDELNDQGLRLVDRSIFAAYLDCAEAGGGSEARTVLEQARMFLPDGRP